MLWRVLSKGFSELGGVVLAFPTDMSFYWEAL